MAMGHVVGWDGFISMDTCSVHRCTFNRLMLVDRGWLSMRVSLLFFSFFKFLWLFQSLITNLIVYFYLLILLCVAVYVNMEEVSYDLDQRLWLWCMVHNMFKRVHSFVVTQVYLIAHFFFFFE